MGAPTERQPHSEATSGNVDLEMPIAIIGMGCRFAGDATNPERLWEMCAAGRDAWSEIPASRFNQKSFYHPNGAREGSTYVEGAHFLKEDLALFDPTFFSITLEEAKAMDPQLRLQLECTYEALENAGLPLPSIAGSDTSVYSGIFSRDYHESLFRDIENLPRYFNTGAGAAMLSNRLSYFFDFKGPSLTCDTGCSTSLVALHLGCQSLRTGESKMSVIGGVNVILNPDMITAMSSFGFVSPSGRSYAFDHRASGYGRGEGVASLILKPLKDALRDGDPIRAVIRNTALNQDGKTAGITLPSQAAQEALIRRCYEEVRLDPTETAYMEAHGTGTQAGDPLEAGAIASTLAKGRTSQNPLYINSVKTNIGHLEAGSGVAAIVRTVLVLERGLIPPSANFEKPNPKIPLDEWGLQVPTKLTEWPKDALRRASVNSLGYGGTNAHIILEWSEDYAKTLLNDSKSNGIVNGSLSGGLNGLNGLNGINGANGTNGVHDSEQKSEAVKGTALERKLFLVSGKDEDATRSIGVNLSNYLEGKESASPDFLNNLIHTLSTRRTHFPWTSTVSASGVPELRTLLSDLKPVRKLSNANPRLGFVFTGQGGQWWAMGRELIPAYPVFRDAMLACDAHIQTLGSKWSIMTELFKGPEDTLVNLAVYSQPICAALQVALVRLLASWGIRPTAVASHSSGEVGAAYAAGALSLEGALTVAYFRGLSTTEGRKKHPELQGGMAAVGLGKEEAEKYLAKLKSGRVVVGCVNSPSSVTASGDLKGIVELKEMLDNDGVFCRKLQVDAGYHSHHIELVAEDYIQYLKGRTILAKNEGKLDVQYSSSVTGNHIYDVERFGPTYWVQNMCQPVLFPDSIRNMVLGPEKEQPVSGTAIDIMIEVGPHSALAGPIRQIMQTPELKGFSIPYTSVLVRKEDAVQTAQKMAGALFELGYPVKLQEVNFPTPIGKSLSVLTDLPPYPWTHKVQHWHESHLNRRHRLREGGPHDLLGVPSITSSPLEPSWRHCIRVKDIPWVKDHVVQSSFVYPGAGYICMAIEGLRQTISQNLEDVAGFLLRDVVISAAVVIPDTADGIELQLHLRPASDKIPGSLAWFEFKIISVSWDDNWTSHCSGFIAAKLRSNLVVTDGSESVEDSFIEASSACKKTMQPEKFYELLRSVDINHGTLFQNLKDIKLGKRQSLAKLTIPDTAAAMPYQYEADHLVHPTTLDTVFQSVFPAAISGKMQGMIPKSFKHIFISTHINRTAGDGLCASSSVEISKATGITAQLKAVNEGDESFAPVIAISGLRCETVSGASDVELVTSERKLCYNMDWEPLEELLEAQQPGSPNGSNGLNRSNGEDKKFVFDHEISIIYGDTEPSWAANLEGLLAEITGKQPLKESLESFDAKDKVILFLYELGKPLLADINPKQWEHLQKLLLEAKGVLWLTRGGTGECALPKSSLVTGFFRTLRVENPTTRYATLDLDPRPEEDGDLPVAAVQKVLKTSFDFSKDSNGLDWEFRQRKDGFMVPRILEDSKMNEEIFHRLQPNITETEKFYQSQKPLRMEVGTPGLMDTLHFVEDVGNGPLPDDYVELTPRAFGLNFRDIMVAMGHMNETIMGYECSGVITAVGRDVQGYKVGDRVCAMMRGHYASSVRLPAETVGPIPDDMPFDIAASIPMVFCTAHYSLYHTARLEKGEKVLIHAAAGGVGQAAVMLAQLVGAEVFVTVGTEEKREFINKTYGIPSDHIFSSRSTAFSRGILKATKGRGVDVVLNSLAGEMLQATWKCIAPLGRFVEIGKRDIELNNHLEMEPFSRHVTFSSIDLTFLLKYKGHILSKILGEVMELLQTSDLVQPVQPITTFKISEVERAFRLMQSGKHRGKVVIDAGVEDVVKVLPSKNSRLFSGEATYVIVGGAGGVGKSIARWMVTRGVRHLIIISRSGQKSAAAQELQSELGESGCHVTICSCDVSNKGQLERVMAENAKTMPPVKGVIQAAMALNDCLFPNMSHGAYLEALQPKVQGTWNMHEVLGSAEVEFFIMLSSAAGIVGNPGQANYTAGSTFLDAVARFRNERGLPAVSIDLGVVGEVGYVAENSNLAAYLERIGHRSISEGTLHSLLESAIGRRQGTASSQQIITGIEPLAGGAAAPGWLEDAKLGHVKEMLLESVNHSGAGSGGDGKALVDQMGAAEGPEEVVRLVTGAIVGKLASDFAIAESDIKVQEPLSHHGVDSLVAVELRNWILRQMRAEVSVFEVLQSKSLVKLAETIAGRWKKG